MSSFLYHYFSNKLHFSIEVGISSIACSGDIDKIKNSKLLLTLSSSPSVVIPTNNNIIPNNPIGIGDLPEDYLNTDVDIFEFQTEPPKVINSHYYPVGKIYDIKMRGHEGSYSFGDQFAEIHYSYNKEELAKAGLIEDFMVYYFDEKAHKRGDL